MSRAGKGRVIDQSGRPGGGPSSGREEERKDTTSPPAEEMKGRKVILSLVCTGWRKPVVAQHCYHSHSLRAASRDRMVGGFLIQHRETLDATLQFCFKVIYANGNFKNQSFPPPGYRKNMQ